VRKDKDKHSAVDGRIKRHEGYKISLKVRKRIEEAFGWIKTVGGLAKTKLIGQDMVLRLLGQHRTSISLGELAELKKIFKVSVASLVVRCSQLGVLTKAAYGRLRIGNSNALFKPTGPGGKPDSAA